MVIKIADTEKDKERKRMEKMLQQHAQFAPYGLSNLQLAASSLMNPLSYSQQQQVGVSMGGGRIVVKASAWKGRSGLWVRQEDVWLRWGAIE